MDRHKDAARLLLSARRDPTQPLNSLPEVLRPKTEEQAYLIQREVLAELGGIGGWKVGSPNPTDPINCAPLPESGIQASPAQVPQARCPSRGVEAEIAVRFGTDLPPRETPYMPDEILAAILSAHPAIELLQSRYRDVEAVDPLSNLADSLSHHGLVFGPAIPDWQGIDLAQEGVRLLVDGAEIKQRTGNPAGSMLRLLVWMANTGSQWAGGLRAGHFVTTGSWTAKDFVPPGARVQVRFARCGEVEVAFG